jgi:hypothetical protein
VWQNDIGSGVWGRQSTCNISEVVVVAVVVAVEELWVLVLLWFGCMGGIAVVEHRSHPVATKDPEYP